MENSSITTKSAIQLIEAAQYGNLKELKKFIEKGRISNYNLEGIDLNQKDKDGECAIHWASRWGHFEIVAELLKFKAKVDEKDKFGRTALRHAASQGNAKIMEYGADPDNEDYKGWTPLMRAVWRNQSSAVTVLIKAGAKKREKAIKIAKDKNLTSLVKIING